MVARLEQHLFIPEVIQIPWAQEYIGIPYNLDNGPDRINGQIPQEGLNCQALVHVLYRIRRGIHIPQGMLSKEIFEDLWRFRRVTRDGEPQEGDIFIFGKLTELNFRKLHLAYHTGVGSLLLHANSVDRRVSVWPLDKFPFYPRYQRLYAIKRIRS